MALTVVGSIAFDSITTPFGSAEHTLGGSAMYAAIAASFFTDVRIIGAVGADFGPEHYEVLERRGIDTGGVQTIPERQTFSWRGHYDFAMAAQTDETHVEAFEGWRPRLSREARDGDVLFLAAMDPQVQADVRSQWAGGKCAAIDSITYWIRSRREALIDAIRGADIVLMNDHEARELTGEPMLLAAARKIVSWRPRAVALRLGEYGCALLTPGGYFSIPGYPLEHAADPTGAGDAFAGAMLGYLDRSPGDWSGDETLRRAVTYGCVLSSFCFEDFGVRRLVDLSSHEIDYRFGEFRRLTHFEHVPLHPEPRNPGEPDTRVARPAPTAGTPVYRAFRRGARSA
jgi:sugar/nucleoside kinase (ribokinase family)